MNEPKYKIWDKKEKVFYLWYPGIGNKRNVGTGYLMVIPFDDNEVKHIGLYRDNRIAIDPDEKERYVWELITEKIIRPRDVYYTSYFPQCPAPKG